MFNKPIKGTKQTRPATNEPLTIELVMPAVNAAGSMGEGSNMSFEDLLAAAEDVDPTMSPQWPVNDEYLGSSLLRRKLSWRSHYNELVSANPSPRGQNTPKTYLERLFPPGSLVCVGTDYANCVTAPLEEFDDLWNASYVVPSPMTAREGLTVGDPEKGILPRLSSRCKANTGRALYVVCRGRVGDNEVQAASIILLTRFARLAMVVEGFRNNLEAWFYVGDQTIHNIRRIKSSVNSSGSGGCSSIACQPYSMPLGVKNWKDYLKQDDTDDFYGNPPPRIERNRVLYFDPPTTFNYRG